MRFFFHKIGWIVFISVLFSFHNGRTSTFFFFPKYKPQFSYNQFVIQSQYTMLSKDHSQVTDSLAMYFPLFYGNLRSALNASNDLSNNEFNLGDFDFGDIDFNENNDDTQPDTTATIWNYTSRDTSVNRGDTLTLFLNQRFENYSNQWFINGELRLNDPSKIFHYVCNINSSGVDTVKSVSTSANKDSLFIQTWIIHVKFTEPTVPEILFSPSSDSFITIQDSLLLSAEWEANSQDSLLIQWEVNGNLIPDHTNPQILYDRNRFIGPVDTVKISITIPNLDSTITNCWYVKIDPPHETMPSFSFIPNADTTLSISDSLVFRVISENSIDSVRYSWFVNQDSVVGYGGDSLFYFAVQGNQNSDTISVQIYLANSDSVYSNKWITKIAPMEKPLFDLAFFPANDTTIARSDSIPIQVRLPAELRDSVTIKWYLNEVYMDTIRTASFLFTPQNNSEKSDTVKVIIQTAALDSMISHTWIINREFADQREFTFSFVPKQDTTITQGDSIIIGVENLSQLNDSLLFCWKKNGDSLEQNNPYLKYKATNLAGKIDTIRLELKNWVTDSLFTYEWRLMIEPRKQVLPVISFFPQQNPTVLLGDSIHFSAEITEPTKDSLIYRWYKNGVLFGDVNDSVLNYFMNDSASLIDTIAVEIHFAQFDSVFTYTWFVFIQQQNVAPLQFSVSPTLDTTVTAGDSISFYVRLDSSLNDSLRYIWMVNDSLMQNNSDSVFSYIFDDTLDSVHNISVAVFSSNSDSLFTHSWIIRTQFEHDLTLNFVAFPTQDTTIHVGDSVRLNIVCQNWNSDSLTFSWLKNNNPIEEFNDSVFHYFANDSIATIDTISVSVMKSNADTLFTWTWILISRLENIALQIVSKFPRQDTTMVVGDTLVFSVKMKDEDTDSLRYRWLVNGIGINTLFNPEFPYMAEKNRGMRDTIQVNISDGDTVITQRWIVSLRGDSTRKSLSCPTLIFPLDGNSLTEEDYLVWGRDSIDVDESLSLFYVIQIAEDSLFTNIVSIDSTTNDTSILLNSTAYFKNINRNKPYYWRVKAFTDDHSESRFNECRNSFFFFPLFAEVTNFYYEKNSDGSVTLYWQLNYEENNVGFNLYRSKSTNGNFKKINDLLIIGEKNYYYTDNSTESGVTYFYQLEEVTVLGKTKKHPPISITAPVPVHFELFPNYPNPFNNATVFKYQIPTKTHVVIEIFNLLGRKIKTIVDETKDAGFYTVSWDGFDNQGLPVVSGIYFYHMSANSFKATRKLTVVR